MLKSLKDKSKTYIGFSTDIEARLKDHNRGISPHTSKYIPWEINTYIAFSDKQKALDFEKYLKSHSGKAFAQKRLWN